jgi:glycosyltransferase involved in cell wall biosynthesis
MELSVIIPCYNAADTIGVQLESLVRQEWLEAWEIIVVNNKSTDASIQIATKYKRLLPQLRIIDASARQGQPYALNVGVRAATGKSLAFCDADDEVALGWIAAMGEALHKYDFVACRIDTKKLNSSWSQQPPGHAQEYGLQQIWYPPYLPHAGGGTLGVKRTLFEKVGGFDEDLPYLHDTDFCFKLQRLGVPLHFVQDAVIHVRYRTTLLGTFRQSRNYAEYNTLLAKKYRADEARKNPIQLWKLYLVDWWNVLRRLSTLRSARSRYWWIWLIGRQIGRLSGSVKYWTPPV